MSSITALDASSGPPRLGSLVHAWRSRSWRRWRRLALAAWAWLTGNQPIRSDAQNYYDLAMQIAQDGPFAFESTFRTYGYPFFLALLIRIVGPDPESVRTAGFVIQLTLFIVAAWFGARRLGRALGMPERTPWIYAATVLCPFILIHAIQMLTDVSRRCWSTWRWCSACPPNRPMAPTAVGPTRRVVRSGCWRSSSAAWP